MSSLLQTRPYFLECIDNWPLAGLSPSGLLGGDGCSGCRSCLPSSPRGTLSQGCGTSSGRGWSRCWAHYLSLAPRHEQSPRQGLGCWWMIWGSSQEAQTRMRTERERQGREKSQDGVLGLKCTYSPGLHLCSHHSYREMCLTFFLSLR